MKCPHCEYENGWNGEEAIDGDLGDFWLGQLSLQRNVGSDYYSNGDREASLVGCPKCKKTFIED